MVSFWSKRNTIISKVPKPNKMALWGFSKSNIKNNPAKNARNTLTKKGLYNNENINIAATLNPTIRTTGDIPLRYKSIKNDKNTKDDPKSGCNKIKSAGPKNKAIDMVRTLVLVIDVLKKLR